MKRTLRLIILIVIAIALLVLFFRNSNPERVGHLIASMSLGWFAIGLITNLGALLFRTLRWRTLINPEQPPSFYGTFFATTIGFMVSTLLPIRAADVMRPALLSRKENIRFSAALGTVLTERVLDLLAILFLLNWFVVASVVNQSFDARKLALLRTAGVFAALLFLAMIAFLVGIFFFHPSVRRIHSWLSRFVPGRFRDAWMGFFDSFVKSLSITKNPAALAKVLLCTAGTWLCLSAQFYFVVVALGHSLPFRSSFFVTGVTIVGMMIPTPGGIGGFHKSCQIVLTSFYGLDIDSSVAVAMIFHIVGTAPVVIVGTILFLREGLSWGLLRKIGENGDQ